MNDTYLKRKKRLNYLFTIGGLIILISSISLFIYDYILEQKAINMSVTITELNYNDGVYDAVVIYNVNKENYKQRIKLRTNNSLTVNDQVKIKYDMNNPQKLINNDHWLLILIFLILSLIIIKLNIKKFINNIKNSIRINNLYKKGFYVNAIITDIMVNNNSKKNKKYTPYKLRCKYLNPNNNIEYIFDSEDTYLNLNEVITKYGRKTVVVVIDKLNTYNYYVDLGSLYPHLKLIDPKEFMANKNIQAKQ